MNNDTAPASRREIWLCIALAVARDGLPEPQGMNLYNENKIASLEFSTHAEVRRWAAEWLKSLEYRPHPDGSLWAFGERDGWSWHLRCHNPEPAHLAEQVVAAILTPDAATVTS